MTHGKQIEQTLPEGIHVPGSGRVMGRALPGLVRLQQLLPRQIPQALDVPLLGGHNRQRTPVLFTTEAVSF